MTTIILLIDDCFQWIRHRCIALPLLFIFYTTYALAIDELDSIQPGHYVGHWGGKLHNEAVYHIDKVESGSISGLVRIVESNTLAPIGTEFGFRLEKNPSGDWHFTWHNPPEEVIETFQALAYPTPQGLLVGAFYETAEQGPCAAGFWLAPNLSRHPKNQKTQMFNILGELEMTATAYTAGDGLASNAARCGLQSPDGYVWIGTISGLSRFDGSEWVNFTPSNSAIPEENITGLIVDHDGRLLMSTKGSGLFYVEDEGHRYIPFAANDSLFNHWIKGLEIGTDGSIWFVFVREKRLGRIDPKGELHSWDLEELGLSHPYSPEWGRHLNDVEPAPDGKVVVTSTQGTALFDPNSGGTFIPGGRNSATSQIKSFGKGQLVITGVTDLSFSSDNFQTCMKWCLPEEFHQCQGVDTSPSGELWIRANNRLLLYAPSSDGLIQLTGIPQDIQNSMELLFKDNEGGLWIVSHQYGVVRLTRNFVRMLTRNPDSDSLTPWQPVMMASSNGPVHVATTCSIDILNQNGLFDHLAHQGIKHPIPRLRYRGLTFSNEPSQESSLWAGLNLPKDMYIEETGNVPVLMRWDPITQECEFVDYPQYPQGSQDISSMVVQGKEVWMANYAGAYIYNTETEKWSVWHENHGLDQFPINTLYVDSKKQIWLGSQGRGLYREKPDGKIQILTKENDLVSDTVSSMFEDNDGSLWIGSPVGLTQIDRNGNVLAQFDKGPFHELAIYAIVEDHQRRLWLGTNNGIFVVSRDELLRYHLGQTPEPAMARIGNEDGLANETVYGEYFPAACRGKDGLLYFCMHGGIACIDPTRTPSLDEGPKVTITGASAVHETPLSLDKPFPAMAQDFLRIDYQATSFTSPDKVRFQYRLLGHSDEWKDIGPQRQFLFPGLAPGGYEFEVKAYNVRGTVSPQLANLAFTIEPYAHQTWWFRVAILLVTLGILYTVYRYQMAWRQRTSALQKKVELEEERSRIARDMHDEIGTALAQIQMLGQLAERKDHATPTDSSKINSLAKHCSQSLREIIWSLDPKNNHFEDLEDYIQHHVDQTLEGTGIRPVYHFQNRKLDFEFPPSMNRQIILILKGILSNVLKHSKATEFELHLTLDKGTLQMDTRDNGQGFDPMNAPHDSLGLTTMRERATKLGGSLRIHSTPGHGCHTTLTLPLDSSPL